MNRAERRRLEKLARTKPAERLETLPGYMAPVEMTPAKIAAMKREIADDLIRRGGDSAAIAQARLDGYEEGHAAGEKFAQQHYLILTYVCMGLAMSDCFGFRARRIARVWHKADEIYAQMLRQLDDGIPLDTVEELFNKRLMDETGLAFGLTNSAESLREQEGVSA